MTESSFDRAALKRSLQRSFVVGNWRVALFLALALLGVALVGGALVSLVHPAMAVALPLALGAALLMLRTPQWGLYATVAVAVLLPFAALPVSIGFKPTFLDVALGATFFVWFMSLLAGRVRRLRVAGISPLVITFMVIAFAAFIAGLDHGTLDKQTLRRFAELLLALALFFVVVDHVRTPRQLEGLAAVIILCGFLSALIGVLLYFLPHDFSNGLLNRLTLFDYPSGFVLRFILDDPTNNQRAISTSVDPNVFGGMMILMTAFAAPQIAAPRPLFPRWLGVGMVGTMVLALALTFSRGSMLGLLVALTPLMLLRYRRLIPWVLLGGLALLALPQAQDYIAHFIAGLRGEDLATQMRFGEYKDALRLIQRYPYLGVGFSSPPDIDLYLGVSSVYLLIAEQMGLIGLAAYLLLNLAFFASAGRAIRRLGRQQPSRAEPLLLGLVSALLGTVFAGIFDHHFFDTAFPHFATLYWLMMGLALAAAHIATETQAEESETDAPSINPLPLILDGAAVR
ncbi:MAG: O-antigen ligase family protein [Ardenticatenales bacterium]|nr:O-antigen ligase family protein [Ardenticatenales bacterium]